MTEDIEAHGDLSECEAANLAYRSRFSESEYPDLWEVLTPDPYCDSITKAELVVIDADEKGLELKIQGNWNDNSARLLRTLPPKSDTSTRLILISNPPGQIQYGFAPVREAMGVLGLQYDIEPQFFKAALLDNISHRDIPHGNEGRSDFLNLVNSRLPVDNREVERHLVELGISTSRMVKGPWQCLGPRALVKIIEPLDLALGKKVGKSNFTMNPISSSSLLLTLGH